MQFNLVYMNVLYKYIIYRNDMIYRDLKPATVYFHYIFKCLIAKPIVDFFESSGNHRSLATTVSIIQSRTNTGTKNGTIPEIHD
jgi:hypothetical protein